MKTFRDEKRTKEIMNVNYWFREEKYTGKSSPGKRVTHSGAVQQEQIHNG